VGVSRDSVESHRQFKEKYGFGFRLLSDADAKLSEAFGAGRRSTFLIDPTGTIVAVWPQVNVEGHAQDVLASLP
jgi:peroxiredoxin Q/BCP